MPPHAAPLLPPHASAPRRHARRVARVCLARRYVLVDEKTASASEILASALQDNGRAQLVGTQTFGKAVIQNVAKLADDSAVVVTTARYETPKRTLINKIGIAPDLKRSGGECVKGTAPLDCLGKV